MSGTASVEVSAVVGSVGSFGVSVAAGSVASLELGEFMFPEPVAVLLGADLSTDPPAEGVRIKWRGAVVGPDGIIYGIPYEADEILEIDPATDVVTRTASTLGLEAVGVNSKWVDGALGSDGRIFGNPHGARNYLILDTTTDPITVSGSTPTPGAGQQLRGGDLANDGKIYSSMFTPSSVFKSLVCSTGVQGANVAFVRDRTGPIYTARPNWEAENSSSSGAYDRYWGATANADGSKIYGTPWGADRISILDVGAGTASQGSDSLTGGHEIPTGVFNGSDRIFEKWSGGALSSLTGDIYCFPRHAQTILKINTADDSATEIEIPAILKSLPINYAKSFSNVEGADGRIYSVPWNGPYFFWIDPRDDSVGWMDLTDVLAGSGIPGNYFTYGASVGNDIYFIPGSATKILKVTVTP